MEGFWPKLRALALLGAGSVIVHELRYVLAYGDGAGAALAEQGHSYLPFIEALVVLVVGMTLARFCVSCVRAFRGIAPEQTQTTFSRTWLGASAALLAMYTLQEGFEGAFAPGHPAGLIGIFGHGGWTAILLSLIVGALIAGLLFVAGRTIQLVAARAAAPRHRRAPARLSWPVAETPPRRRLDVLALNLAGRAPPA
jgi:hypothetical protein